MVAVPGMPCAAKHMEKRVLEETWRAPLPSSQEGTESASGSKAKKRRANSRTAPSKEELESRFPFRTTSSESDAESEHWTDLRTSLSVFYEEKAAAFQQLIAKQKLAREEEENRNEPSQKRRKLNGKKELPNGNSTIPSAAKSSKKKMVKKKRRTVVQTNGNE